MSIVNRKASGSDARGFLFLVECRYFVLLRDPKSSQDDGVRSCGMDWLVVEVWWFTALRDPSTGLRMV